MIQRNHSSEEILRQFGEIEGYDISPQKFRKSGNWLISEAYFKQLIGSVFSRKEVATPPGFRLKPTWRGLGTLLYRRLFGKGIVGDSSADAIYVKSNARAFYMKAPLRTTKLGLESSTRALTSLRNEIDVRERLEKIEEVLIPKMFASFSKSPPCYLSEELVLGRRSNAEDDPKVIGEVMHSLVEMYEAVGVSWSKASGMVASDAISRIEKSLSALDWQEGWLPQSELLAFVEKILQAQELVPCSLTHGDLSLGNMLLDEQGRVYLVDWECAKVRPIVFDLGRLLEPFPELESELRQVLAMRCVEGASMSYEKQLALMYLNLLANYSEVAQRPKVRGQVEKVVVKLIGLQSLAL